MNIPNLMNIISGHPDIKHIKETVSRLMTSQNQSPMVTTTEYMVSPDVIAEIQTNLDNLFEQVGDGNNLAKIQEELQTRTELLATEIYQVKDMVLQLQSTVINTLLPAIVNSQPLLSSEPQEEQPLSTLETFTEAPLEIIPQDPAIAAATLEENLNNAELPILSEPLTYQES
jgi:hypothetical protein